MGCREGLRFVSVHKLEETLAGLTVSLSVFKKVSLLEKLKVIQLVAMKESLSDLLTVAYWAISLGEKTAVRTVATVLFSLAVSSAADVVDEMVVH